MLTEQVTPTHWRLIPRNIRRRSGEANLGLGPHLEPQDRKSFENEKQRQERNHRQLHAVLWVRAVYQDTLTTGTR